MIITVHLNLFLGLMIIICIDLTLLLWMTVFFDNDDEKGDGIEGQDDNRRNIHIFEETINAYIDNKNVNDVNDEEVDVDDYVILY